MTKKKFRYKPTEPERMMIQDAPAETETGIYAEMGRKAQAEEARLWGEDSNNEASYLQQMLELYPEDDGEPLADNTLHLKWIFIILAEIRKIFFHQENVFVASNLLWYPTESRDVYPVAPDVMVVFGRPKRDGDMVRVYYQWKEENKPPRVAFEVRSPSNKNKEMKEKLAYYDKYGVDEYYVLDPSLNAVEVWERNEGSLCRVEQLEGWSSPLMGISFTLAEQILISVNDPDGIPFLDPVEARMAAERAQAAAEAEAAHERKIRMEAESAQAAAEAAQAAAEAAQAAAEAAQATAEAAQATAEVAREGDLTQIQELRALLAKRKP